MKSFPAEGRFKPFGFDLVSQSAGLAVPVQLLKPRPVGEIIHLLLKLFLQNSPGVIPIVTPTSFRNRAATADRDIDTLWASSRTVHDRLGSDCQTYFGLYAMKKRLSGIYHLIQMS